MNRESIHEAASILWQNWSRSSRIDELPVHCRPADRSEGYAIQAALARLSGQQVLGWKIAATSPAGQQHIGVDGPLAGRLLSGRILNSEDVLTIGNNIMKVVEAEFAFRMREALPPRQAAYAMHEVLDAVESMHPAIEIPDSRYHDFARVGAPQLIADNACACWFVLGEATSADWRLRNLAAHRVTAVRNGIVVAEGHGANVLGDPRKALTWIANELRNYDAGLQAGEVVTTGTCVVPQTVAPGDIVRADFGEFGTVTVQLR